MPTTITTNVTLGKRYRDSVTGFEGTATSVHLSLNGCVQIGVTPSVTEKNAMPKSWSIDDAQLVEIETGEPVTSAAPRGGPPVEIPR